ncbi:MAG: histidinol-phosphate transaminase [Pseudomonadota bacterium]
MTAQPTPQPGVLDIKAYVPGAAKATGEGPVYKLSSNEACFPPSEAAQEAIREAAARMDLYPDGAATALREELAKRHGLDAARIVCGAGSDELLNLLAQAYVGVGDAIVQSEHGFLVYAIAAMANGGRAVKAPERDYRADIDALLAAVDETTRIVFLANPNNPTGTYVTGAELRRLRDELREDVLLVVDAAYAEYVDAPDYEDGAQMVEDYDNVVMTRTFSKAYGLGGLRLGWAYGPAAVIDALNRIRGPFNVSAPAIAGGVAALRDRDHVARVVAHTNEWRAWLAQQIGGLGLKTTPSVCNFVLIDFSGHGDKTAAAAEKFLAARGVLTRGVAAYGLPDHLRVSVGTEEANRTFINALSEFLS